MALNIKPPEALLNEEIEAGNLTGVELYVTGRFANIVEGTPGLTHPLLQAMKGKKPAATRIAKYIIDQIIKKSPDKAIPDAVLDLTDSSGSAGFTALACAAIHSDAMLEAIWPHYRGRRDINMPFGPRQHRLVHLAAIHRDRLAYLLSEGADINARDDHQRTPLHLLYKNIHALSKPKPEDEWNTPKAEPVSVPGGGFRLRPVSSPSLPPDETKIAVSDILSLYEQYNADFHATDINGRNLAFYALDNSRVGAIGIACIEGLERLLAHGVDFTLRDKAGNTPFDHMLDNDKKWAKASGVDQAFTLLADRGYDISAVMEKYAAKDAIKAIAPWFEGERQKLRRELMETDLVETLWDGEGKPSALLLKACGYGVLEAAFENPLYKDYPASARRLYQKMEEKLPPQCKDVLHTKVDIASAERAVRNKPANTIGNALRRKKLPGEDNKGRPPGRQV